MASVLNHVLAGDLAMPQLLISEIEDEDDGIAAEKEDRGLDPDRYGPTERPTMKAAELEFWLSKTAAPEPSGITDPENGGEILVSTTARILFRKTFPKWAKVRNKELNEVIAKAFAQGQPHQYFKPKKGAGTEVGEVRLYGQTKYIGIIMGSDVRIIAVKGSLPNIGDPQVAPGQGKPDGSGWQVAQVGDALKGAV